MEELVSLNEELHTEFSITELEQRLETDPLMFANLLMEQEYNCTVPGALIINNCADNGNLCTSSDAYTVNLCEIKLKEGGDVDICSPICNSVL